MKKENKKLIAIQRLAFDKPGVSLFGKNIKISNSDSADANLLLKKNWKLIDIESETYPLLLRFIFSPPKVLTIAGDETALFNDSIAIVGARKATSLALESSYKVAFDLARLGFTIVSGLAYGIDSAAHRGALDAKGKTIAVLGCGMDIDYPARNFALRKRIIDNGALVSEFPIGTTPYPANFPRRNRIISGLCSSVVLIQAARRSGSIITAMCGLNQGRDVFVLKNKEKTIYNEGGSALLDEGAIPIESARDVVSHLKKIYEKNPGHKGTYTDKAMPAFTIAELAALSGVNLVVAVKWLSRNEKLGRVISVGNGRYKIK